MESVFLVVVIPEGLSLSLVDLMVPAPVDPTWTLLSVISAQVATSSEIRTWWDVSSVGVITPVHLEPVESVTPTPDSAAVWRTLLSTSSTPGDVNLVERTSLPRMAGVQIVAVTQPDLWICSVTLRVVNVCAKKERMVSSVTLARTDTST